MNLHDKFDLSDVQVAREEITMPSAICPRCDDLVGISVTDEPVKATSTGEPIGTAMKWRIDLHRISASEEMEFCYEVDEDKPFGGKCLRELPCETHGMPICDGSGLKI